jgi:hypothetical protein
MQFNPYPCSTQAKMGEDTCSNQLLKLYHEVSFPLLDHRGKKIRDIGSLFLLYGFPSFYFLYIFLFSLFISFLISTYFLTKNLQINKQIKRVNEIKREINKEE